MKKILLSLILVLSVSFAEDFDIPEDNVVVVNANKKEDSIKSNKLIDIEKKDSVASSEASTVLTKTGLLDDLKNTPEEKVKIAPKKEKEVRKIEIKNYSNIRYNQSMESYSIINHDKTEFNKFLTYLKLPDLTIEGMLGTAINDKAIRLNAYAYDYVKKQPNIAENYYLLFSKLQEASFYEKKIRYADFLLRTGRPAEILDLIPKYECSANINASAVCNYYIGIAIYLTTGDNKNVSLRLAKDYIKKAKEVYDKK